ncbi:MAG: hypothetical protein U5N85_08890 [Arcicella sp.]|nr:hypothetical protein [Arcicella sp.]
MDKLLVKKYQEAIKNATSQEEKQSIASQLHTYVSTLSLSEQEEYKTGVIMTIESKFEVMDKLLAAYEAIKKDDLVLA